MWTATFSYGILGSRSAYGYNFNTADMRFNTDKYLFVPVNADNYEKITNKYCLLRTAKYK